MVKFSSRIGDFTSTGCKGSTVLPCWPYPIHHSLLLFPQLEVSLFFFLEISWANASFLEISWANNASPSPPPLCHRAEHHQGHPESLQENIFQSTQSATSGLVIDQARPVVKLPEAQRQAWNLTTYTPTLSCIDSTCIPRNWTRPIPNKFATLFFLLKTTCCVQIIWWRVEVVVPPF